MKLGFIGTGAITEAIVVGLMEAEFPLSEIIVSARGAATAARLAASFEKVRICTHNQDIVDGSDLLFLAVRPQIAEEVISSLAFPRDKAIVSLIAMLPAEKIAEWIGHPVDVTRAIRATSLISGARRLTGPFLRDLEGGGLRFDLAIAIQSSRARTGSTASRSMSENLPDQAFFATRGCSAPARTSFSQFVAALKNSRPSEAAKNIVQPLAVQRATSAEV